MALPPASSRWTNVGGDEWQSGASRLPPRTSTSRLFGLERSTRGSAATGASAGGGGAGASSSVPFSRTAKMADRRRMEGAMRFDVARRRAAGVGISGTAVGSGIGRKGSPAPRASTAQSRAEALAQSKLARLAFQDALRHGKVRPRTLKLMFVGQGRAGKTSTLKALTGQGFDPTEASTHGLSSALPLVRADSGANVNGAVSMSGTSLDLQSSFVSKWQVVDHSEHEVHDSELRRSCAHFIAERLRGDGANANVAAVEDSAGGGQVNGCNDDATSLPGDMEFAVSEGPSAKMPVDLVVKLMEAENTEAVAEEPVMLKTWDFGGQREYYVMHHLFLTNRGVYLVVTRLDAWLRPDLESGAVIGDEQQQIQEEHDGGAFEPPLEALSFWLSSIHMHAPDAIVIIVGTHADKVVSCKDEVEARVEGEIVRLMERVPGVERQVVVNDADGLCFFPVDNSLGSSGDGIQALRACIDRETASALAEDGPFGQELPLPWVRLREALEDCSEGSMGDDGVLPMTATFVLALSKVREMAHEAGIDAEADLLACLRCLHAFGNIVFFDEDDLRDTVVLNTQWLADAMAHVLNCPRVVRGGVAATKRLRERGELEDDLLRRHLWRAPKFREHHEVLLRMLYRFDLIIPGAAELPSSGNARVHIVPCLLPRAPPPLLEQSSTVGGDWNSLYVDLHGLLCCLLPTLFPKLVVASSRRPDVSAISSLGLYRDSFRLLWADQELVMDLLPPDRPQVVRVRALASHDASVVSNGSLVDGTGLASAALPVSIVRELLRLLDSALSWSNHLSFTAGVLCGHCHARGRSQSERYHVIDVNELLTERIVVCRHNARVVTVPEDCWAARWLVEEATISSGGTLPRPPQSPPSPASPPTLGAGALLTEVPEDCLTAGSGPSAWPSYAPTVSTDSSLRDSSCPSTTPNTSRACGAAPICLLYASPLWREGDNGGAELPSLDVQQEVSLLMEVTASTAQVRVELATASNLARLLTTAPEGRPSALHLSLHCADSGQQLLLEDDHGGAHAFSVDDLRGLLAATGGAERLPLVFLHACSSDLAGQVFVEAGAPHVICCRGAVFDATARCFTRAFYHALYAGARSVGQAFDIAVHEISTAPQRGLRSEAVKYVLLPVGDPAHSTARLDGPRGSVGSLAPSEVHATLSSSFALWPSSSSGALPGRVEDFCGRSRVLWMLMQHITSSRRCTMVYGSASVGKSAVLIELARFAGACGRRFEGRVVHLAPSADDLRDDIAAATGCVGEDAASRPLLMALLRALVAAIARAGGAGFSAASVDETEADLMLSPATDARLLRVRAVQGLQRLEAQDQRALLIIDGFDDLVEEPSAAEEFRKVLTELLLRTERVVLVLGARRACFQTLGMHKVVAFQLPPLQDSDAARLFLWRVHRPLVVADLSEIGGEAARGLPLIVNVQNRNMVLSQLASHPLLRHCAGNPGLLRSAADRILPGGGSLWDVYASLVAEDGHDPPGCVPSTPT
eukprot:TRINITY_DN23299_c0_g1_i1.p1 TRINITY_DN23299_c0_g1~~TRINITY_DN23299_c0_g1_i1.p1  ORF type:complete len:1489 (+),score=280.72 TRINITY_DN23299_c0_g1_i1:111-4577(+)